jgi:tRNA dimethylallyltransferase
MAQQRVIVITGPTASGKSAAALALARARQGTVINADAMQTYDAFPILTAQPTEEERAGVPHRLYGVLPLSETLSAARWRTLAAAEIERCLGEGRTPILCGGSGLYLRTLMQGIAAIPDRRPACATRPRRMAGAGRRAFRARLAEQDPAIVARLKPGDRQRHVRAWEVFQATGRPLSAWQKGEGEAVRWRFATVLLAPERGWLRNRIESRFDAMLKAGVLAEVRAVFDRAPDPRWPGLKAHGAPELFGHFRGELSLDQARRIAIDHTRQYAKRQMTWFRHQMTPDLVLDPQANPDLEQTEKLLTNSGV